MNVFRSGVSGIFLKVVGGASVVDVGPNDVFVHLKRLEEKSFEFFERMKSNKMCFRLNKVLFLDRIYLDEASKPGKTVRLLEKEEEDLILKFLKAEGLCDEVKLSDGKVFVKIVDKRQSEVNPFTQQVTMHEEPNLHPQGQGPVVVLMEP